MENVNVHYVHDHELTYIRPEIEGINFIIKLGKYKHEGHAIRAVTKLCEKLHLRITDKSLKISQKRKKI